MSQPWTCPPTPDAPAEPPATADIEALIARLAAASEGSRELDAAIATRLWGEPIPSGNIGGPRALFWWHNGLARSIAPEFTESLDAALTLLPAGLYWACGAGKTRPDEPLFGAATYRPQVSEDPEILTSGQHETSAAIALCIAALKARSEIPRGTGDGE